MRCLLTGLPPAAHLPLLRLFARDFRLVPRSRETAQRDAGYSCLPWLLTPINRPLSSAEAAYNVAHTKTRVVIKRCFGVLKSRFRCMSLSGRFLCYSPSKVGDMFIACSILHNIARHGGLLEEIEDTTLEDDIPTTAVETDHRGNEARQELISNYFSG